jgi:hypothetical protein
MIQRYNRNIKAPGLAGLTPPRDNYRLTIRLESADGQSSRSSTLDLENEVASPPQFLLFELPAQVRSPGGTMVQKSNLESEFRIRLAGPATPAVLTNLSGTPTNQWMATLFARSASCPAVIGVLFANGRVSLAVYGEENQ